MSKPMHGVFLLTVATASACSSSPATGPDAGVGTDAGVLPRSPWGLAYDGAGNLYVSDNDQSIVRQIVLATGVATTIAGFAGNEGDIDGMGAAAQFDYPAGLAYDGAGSLFVGSSFAGALRKVVVATGEVTTVAGSGQHGGLVDGTGSAAELNEPESLALDGAGNLYLADTQNCAIRKVVLSTTAVTTLAGSGCGLNGGSADGTGAAAHFSVPSGQGLVYDGAGNLYVADSGNGAIRKIVASSGVVTTVTKHFVAPWGLALEGTDDLYVADNGDLTVRKVVLSTGAITLVAGSAGNRGSADGTGASAQFASPAGLALDGQGNLYVADRGNGSIRKIVLSTESVTTLAWMH